jgi:hypothetical protein
MSGLNIYESLIESVGAEIMEHGSEVVFASEQPTLLDDAKSRYGKKTKLIYIEYWHDGGCSAAGVSNHTIYHALKKAGWDGQRIGKDHDGDFLMVWNGGKTRRSYTIHRAESSEKGFNLIAEPVFLPTSDDEEAFEHGKIYLAKILEELISVRTEVSKIINLALLKEARNQNL